MIVFDDAARQQNLELLMNRDAPDKEESMPSETSISWESYVNLPVFPRRSPWRTIGEDVEKPEAKVSEKQVSTTIQNFSTTVYSNASSGSSPSISSSSSINEASLYEAILSDEIIAQITAAVLASLPIVDFTCPE